MHCRELPFYAKPAVFYQISTRTGIWIYKIFGVILCLIYVSLRIIKTLVCPNNLWLLRFLSRHIFQLSESTFLCPYFQLLPKMFVSFLGKFHLAHSFHLQLFPCGITSFQILPHQFQRLSLVHQCIQVYNVRQHDNKFICINRSSHQQFLLSFLMSALVSDAYNIQFY